MSSIHNELKEIEGTSRSGMALREHKGKSKSKSKALHKAKGATGGGFRNGKWEDTKASNPHK